jgi:hypothetical protein
MQGYVPPGMGYPPYGGTPQPAPLPGPYGPPKAKKPLLPMIVLIFAIICIIMLVISLALPWYSVKSKSGNAETLLTFGGIESSNNGDSSTSWDKTPYDNLKNLYQATQVLVILSLVIGILFLVGTILAMMGKSNRFALIFGLLTIIVCLLAPIIFLAIHPGAVKDDMGTQTGGDVHESFIGSDDTYSWGPGLGWIFCIIAFIFALIGFVLAFRLPTPDTGPTVDYAPAPAPMQAPMYPTYPQMQQPPPTYPPQQPPPYYQPPQY